MAGRGAARNGAGYSPPPLPPAAHTADGGAQKITPTPANRPGGQQGDRQASIQQQEMAPLRQGGVATPAVAPAMADPSTAEAPPIPAGQVFGPSQRPWEHVTAGATLGPGAAPDQAAMIADQVRALYQQYPYDGVRALLEEIDTNRGAL